MSAQVEYKDYERLIAYTARRVLRRLKTAGLHSVQIEDVIQECSIAWMTAREHWDPNNGTPFTPYMLRGVMHHINRWVVIELRQLHIAPFELDLEMTDDSKNKLHDIVPDRDAEPADEIVHRKQIIELAKDSVTPRTWQFIELLSSPPQELVEIFRGMQARARFARGRGVQAIFAPQRITPTMVLDLMKADRTERTQIGAEIERLEGEMRRACSIKWRDLRNMTARTSQL